MNELRKPTISPALIFQLKSTEITGISSENEFDIQIFASSLSKNCNQETNAEGFSPSYPVGQRKTVSDLTTRCSNATRRQTPYYNLTTFQRTRVGLTWDKILMNLIRNGSSTLPVNQSVSVLTAYTSQLLTSYLWIQIISVLKSRISFSSASNFPCTYLVINMKSTKAKSK